MLTRPKTDKDVKPAAVKDESNGLLKEATDKGYFGDKVDPEPNESYTLQGVTKAK